MAQSGYTPLLIYGSGTASNVPLAANLTSSASGAELALNYADGKLYFKNSSGVVTLLASSTATGGSFTSITDSGNLTFTGTGNRITGDFSNATVANRVLFQSSTTNGITVVGLIPNGTATSSGFSVYNNADPTNSSISSFNNTSTDTRILATISGTGTYLPMTFYTGGTERARIDTSGNVGIGTSSPSYKLDVNANVRFGSGSGQAIVRLDGGNSGTNNGSSVYFLNAGTMSFGIGNYSSILGGAYNTDALYYLAGANNHIWTTGGSTERMRIDTSGNVGIGTATANLSSSSTALTVNTGTAANFAAFELASAGTLNYYINANNAAVYHVAAGARPWIVSTNGSERMRIDSSGNVLVGTTSNTSTVGTAIRYAFDASSTVFIGKNNSPANVNWMEFAGGGATRAVLAWDTTGGGAFFGSTTTYPVSFYTNNTERMRIDSSGNVGIGTTSPANGRLDVVTSSGAAYINIRRNSQSTGEVGLTLYGGTSSNNWSMYMPTSSNDIRFNTAGVDRLVISSAGDVGIGTTGVLNYTARLKVLGPTNQTVAELYGSGTNNTAMLALANDAGSVGIAAVSGNTVFYTNGITTERMRIDSSGNVGIGTSSPSSPLNVVSASSSLAIAINGRSSDNLGAMYFYANNGSTQYSTITASATEFRLSSVPAAAVQTFYTNGSERMRIDSSGNVGIGTSSPSQKLEVAGNVLLSNNQYLGVKDTTGAAVGFPILTGSNDAIFGYLASGTTGISTYQFRSGNNVERMRIDTNGNVQVQAGAVMPYAPAPAAISAATTLTNANIQGQIISATGTTYTITMALGTTLETLATWATTNIGYDFFVINTASGTVTMAVNTGVTSLGTLTIATGVSAHFRIRRTAANTFVLYRLS